MNVKLWAGTRHRLYIYTYGFPGGTIGKETPLPNIGDLWDTGLIPGLGISHGGWHSNPLQYSCLENPMDRGAWQAAVHRVAQSQTQLKWLSTHVRVYIYIYMCIYIHTHIYIIYLLATIASPLTPSISGQSWASMFLYQLIALDLKMDSRVRSCGQSPL